jgi:hypothetical protein
MSWDEEFPEAIAVPGRLPLVTLRDAALYVTSLPKVAQNEPRWQKATHILMQAADHGGPVEFGRLGMIQALFPKGEPVCHSASKYPIWRNNRKLARDR